MVRQPDRHLRLVLWKQHVRELIKVGAWACNIVNKRVGNQEEESVPGFERLASVSIVLGLDVVVYRYCVRWIPDPPVGFELWPGSLSSIFFDKALYSYIASLHPGL